MYKMTDERWEGILRYFEHLWSDPKRLESIPERSLLLSLSEEEVTRVFMELVRVLKEKEPETMTSLAELVKRDLTAVERDLQILKGFGIVELEKVGRTVKPRVTKDFLILPLVPLKPFTLEDLEEHAAKVEG
jgi:predicted transcriptional regulator